MNQRALRAKGVPAAKFSNELFAMLKTLQLSIGALNEDATTIARGGQRG